MSKKNFIEIARILAGDFAISTPLEQRRVWALTLSLADYFARENSGFDRDKFYLAVFGNADQFEVRDTIEAECSKYLDGMKSAFTLNR